MIGFPGSIYDAEGTSLITGLPDLTPERISLHPCRSMVARDAMSPVAQVWLLADDAEFPAIPRAFKEAALALMSAGRAILILSRRPEPGADVRDELLAGFELADALPDENAAT